MRIFLLIFTTFFAFADDHKAPNFEGLLSSEVFDLDGKLDMYVEKRSTCSAGVPKHFHPALGTVVYVLSGKSQSKSTGDWKTYESGE